MFIFGCAGPPLLPGLSFRCGEQRPLSSCDTGASLAAGHGSRRAGASGVAARELCSFGSWSLEHKLNRCAAQAESSRHVGSFPNRGSSLHLLHWQVGSLAWSHQGSLVFPINLELLSCSYLQGENAQSAKFSYPKRLRVCILVHLPLSAGRLPSYPSRAFQPWAT